MASNQWPVTSGEHQSGYWLLMIMVIRPTRTLVLRGALVGALLVGVAAAEGRAQEGAEPATTRIVVRVVARDAKIIGSGVGGALVRVVNAETGEVLAEGRQEGGTGDTELIMSTARARGMSVYDTDGAASFVAEFQIAEPTPVVISGIGPLGHPQATRSASKQMLVMPGANIAGDGVVLELHGFIVEIQMPEPLTPPEGRIDVRARVRMLCGCPLTPGGLWDSNDVEIVARLLADGEIVASSPLEFAGQASIFAGALDVPPDVRGRDLELEVVSADPERINFGRHVIPLAGY